MLGAWIVIEGPDRTGKETQAKMLVSRLSTMGYHVEHLETPVKNGKFDISYKLIRKMLATGSAIQYPTLFQTFQALNRLLVLPWLLTRKCDYVVIDRWVPSMIVYGLASGANKTVVKYLSKLFSDKHFTILIKGQSFARPNEIADSYERSNLFQNRVSEFYSLWFSGLSADDACEISNDGTPEEVHERIMCALTKMNAIP